jgi:hypothetical protein
MDFTKFPLEKLLYFVAGVIPGSIALLIFQLAYPGTFDWFFVLGFLGYKTKLCVMLLVAFVVGNSLTTFLDRFLGAIGGAIGGMAAGRPYKSPHSYDVAPWRDPRWRAVLKKHLGAGAPKDTSIVWDELYKQRCAWVNLGPEQERPAALMALSSEKFNSEMDDDAWARWYNHYHWIILFPEKQDFAWHIAKGLNFNLETASLYVLVSAAVVPAVRHWWCILPACLWVLLLIAESYTGMKNATDQWSTLEGQIRYLSDGGGGTGDFEKALEAEK